MQSIIKRPDVNVSIFILTEIDGNAAKNKSQFTNYFMYNSNKLKLVFKDSAPL